MDQPGTTHPAFLVVLVVELPDQTTMAAQQAAALEEQAMDQPPASALARMALRIVRPALRAASMVVEPRAARRMATRIELVRQVGLVTCY